MRSQVGCSQTEIEWACGRTLRIDIHAYIRRPMPRKPGGKVCDQVSRYPLAPIRPGDKQVLKLTVAVEPTAEMPGDVADHARWTNGDVANTRSQSLLRMVSPIEVGDHAFVSRICSGIQEAAACHFRHVGRSYFTIGEQAGHAGQGAQAVIGLEDKRDESLGASSVGRILGVAHDHKPLLGPDSDGNGPRG
jgi:hypothetical protein